jgi:hypothetical protein
MNCVEFGFDRSRGLGSAMGQFWPIAIDRPTRPYNIASTTVPQVIVRKVFEVIFHLSVGPPPANRLQPFLAHRVTSPT